MNRALWDERAGLHRDSDFYGVDDVINGKPSLQAMEYEELGDLTGKQIVHLQCHIGTDSVSLALLGAQSVVGVDFSPESIRHAREIAQQADVDDRVTFIVGSVADASQLLGKKFDVVYTSWGVLAWLPSIQEWATTVSQLLTPHGYLYLADEHPFTAAVDIDDHGMRESKPYDKAQAIVSETTTSYADRAQEQPFTIRHLWAHGLGEITTALANAGMRIDWLHEHPQMHWRRRSHPGLVHQSDGTYSFLHRSLPLSFSLRATLSV